MVMIRRAIGYAAAILAAALAVHAPGAAAQQAYSFNVLNQRSIALTAQYWNPILIYVSRKSGVPLELKLAKTAQESFPRSIGYDFLYTNHFTPSAIASASWSSRARLPSARARGAEDSPIQTLQDLQGKTSASCRATGSRLLAGQDAAAGQGASTSSSPETRKPRPRS
jgi:phosphonate transport system substrate-binding protein